MTEYAGLTAFLPNNRKFEHAPDFNVSHIPDLEDALEDYLEAVTTVKTGFTNPLNIKGNLEDYFLYNLLRDMANSDYEDLANYVRRRTEYIKDTTFNEFDTETQLGQLDEFSLSAKRTQELHGLETPFAMNFFFRNHSKPYRLPKVRYAISDEEKGKTACIYCVQDGQLGTQKIRFAEELEKKINGVNKGMKTLRNCEPRQVLSLTLFIKMLHEKGIRNITAPDYIPLRYGIRYDENAKHIKDDDILDAIQSRTTDSFMRLFQRLQEQVEGITITSIPGEMDSYMHVELADELGTKNELLSQLCGITQTATASLSV